MSVWRELETGLGSVGKIRILRVMFDKPSQVFTKYALERETGLKPVEKLSQTRGLPVSLLIKILLKRNPNL